MHGYPVRWSLSDIKNLLAFRWAVRKECDYAALETFYFGLSARLAREGWNAYNKRAF